MASPGRGVDWGCGGRVFFLGGGGIQGKSCFHIQRFHSQFASPRDSYAIFLFKKMQIAVYILALLETLHTILPKNFKFPLPLLVEFNHHGTQCKFHFELHNLKELKEEGVNLSHSFFYQPLYFARIFHLHPKQCTVHFGPGIYTYMK